MLRQASRWGLEKKKTFFYSPPASIQFDPLTFSILWRVKMLRKDL